MLQGCSRRAPLHPAAPPHPAARRVAAQAQASRHAVPAFVFDIDGVLVRGKEVLPCAKRALRQLYTADGTQPVVPVAFLTNGGGVTEADKAAELTTWLGVQVSADQVVLSHTPYRQLAHLHREPVLLSGRGSVLHVAESYGYDRTITTGQLALAHPAAVPFSAAAPADAAGSIGPRRQSDNYGTVDAPLCAVLVFNDPVDWYIDLQIITDIIIGGGVLGRRPEDVPAGGRPVEVYFPNYDLLWANEFPSPRFGQGAFAVCLEALHQRLTGEPLRSHRCMGKPNAEPYLLVEQLLEAQARRLGMPLLRTTVAGSAGRVAPRFPAIFAVGDNPAADVRGANAAGHPWVSMLVKTGIFGGATPNCRHDPAHIVAEDVEHAVKIALSLSAIHS